MVQSDAQRIAEIYRHAGRYDVSVVPEIIEQPNNRVDLIFTITEGNKTGINSIEFIGNKAYSSYRLKDVIKTRESNLLSFLGGGDLYDPDRIEADRDLIRRLLSEAQIRRRAGGSRADGIRSAAQGLSGNTQDRGGPAVPGVTEVDSRVQHPLA